MEDNYSIDEILSVVNDLQNINNNKNKKISKEPSNKPETSNIPKNTLRLIVEAEKSKN